MQVSFNYCPTAFDLDLLVYTEMLCKDAVDLNALKEDVFHLAQSKICTTRNLGLSNLVNADYKIKYDSEIQLAEDEEMIDFGSEPYVEDYKIQTSEERCILPDIDILQRELEKMQAELGLKDLVSEEVDLDNLKNSEDNSQQTKFCSSVESVSDLAEDKVEEVEEKEEDENSSVSEVDLTAEAAESKSADNQVISSSETTDEIDEKTQEELLEEAKRNHGISNDDEVPDFSSLCSGFMSDNADILSDFDSADSDEESKQGTPLEEEQVVEQEVQEQGTADFEDEYLDNDILNSIEVVEEIEEDTDFDYPDEDEDDSDDFSSDEEGSEDILSDDEDDSDDFSSDEEDEEESYDFNSDEDDDSEDISSGYEDDEDDSEDISSGYEDDDEEDEASYDFSESDDDAEDDISSDESDDQPIEESIVYEDEYLDSDIYSNIKILKKVKKKKQGVSEASSSATARQTTKSKNSSSTLGVETKKSKDSSNVNDSSKSSGSLSKASKEAPKGAPSLEKVVAQPKKSEFGSRDEEPKDLRSFLRKHPHCEMSVIYKYFTKKEVQNALLTGKVVKKGTQLHI